MNNLNELIKGFEIKNVLQCFETSGYFRFIAEADKEFGDVIPTIFLKFPPGKSNYLINENILMLRIFDRMVTFFPNRNVVITNTKDREEAVEVLEEIRGIINEAYQDCLKYGKPNGRRVEAVKKISWKDLYECLPQINCGKCGLQLCSSFALGVMQGEKKLADCEPLSDSKYYVNLKGIKNKLGPFLLQTLGWE